MPRLQSSPSAAFTSFCLLVAAFASPARATNYAEQEPNDSKFAGNSVPFAMASGDTITGLTTGISTAPGNASQDHFLISTAAAPLGIYQHRLTITSPTLFQQGTIRGLTQTAGVINPNTDVAAQTNNPNAFGPLPPRTVQWYGFGRGEQIYYRVTGNSSATMNYTATLTTTPVSSLVATVTFNPGDITITGASSFPQADLDIWIYDSNFNPIPTFGRDEPEPVMLMRNYPAGIYYAALTSANFANNQSQPDDPGEDLNQPVLDFPDASLTSSGLFFFDVSASISDGTNFEHINAIKDSIFDIVWVQFTVGTPPACACRGDMDANGALNGLDIRGYVECRLSGTNCACADVNNDGMVTAADDAALAARLVNGDTCP